MIADVAVMDGKLVITDSSGRRVVACKSVQLVDTAVPIRGYAHVSVQHQHQQPSARAVKFVATCTDATKWPLTFANILLELERMRASSL